MSKNISGNECRLSQIFSAEFAYEIPPYQRPYAWTVDQASDLFDDLSDFYLKEKDDSYFLGSIVLIKEEGRPQAEVIDGQQRLTTLTVLFACIAERLQGDDKLKFLNYLREPGNRFEQLLPLPRLKVRQRDEKFFEQYIQNLEFDALAAVDPQTLANESQIKMRGNALLMRKRLAKSFDTDDALAGFASFLVTRCFLVAVSTPSAKSAFRVFSVMNSRGLDLLPIDIIKADLIGQMSEGDRDEYTKIWEELEVAVGRDGFNDLFGHIRMIFAREKARRALLEEFHTHVLSRHSDPKTLIENIIEPYAEAFCMLIKANYRATENAAEINQLLGWLKRIEHSDWLPPTILFMSRFGQSSSEVLPFLKKMERLASCLYLCSYYINDRIERYAEIIGAIEQADSAEDVMESLELKREEHDYFAELLNDDIYTLPPRKRKFVLLRLDSFLSDGAAVYDPTVFTIEHVFPQTVPEGSDWETLWPKESTRAKWLHRLGNLVPLNRQRNSAAQNFDFAKKKDKYFRGRNEVSSYVLTSQVLGESEWTPKVVKARHRLLLGTLYDNWDLNAGESPEV